MKIIKKGLVSLSLLMMILMAICPPCLAQSTDGPSPWDSGILNWLYNKFADGVTGIYGKMLKGGMSILRVIVGIEIIFFGIYIAMGGQNVIMKALEKIIYISLVLAIMKEMPSLLNEIVGYIGKITSDNPAMTSLTNPSAIILKGLELAKPIWEASFSLFTILNIETKIAGGISFLLIVIAYAWLAIECFMTLIELWLVCGISVILLPFTIWEKTKFIGEGVFKGIVVQLVKLLTIAFIIAIINPITLEICGYMQAQNPFEASGIMLWFGGFLSMLLWSLLIVYVSFKSTRIAGGLVSGTPSLGAGGAVGMVIGGAVAGVAAVGTVVDVATGGASMPVTGAINKSMDNFKAATDVATKD